MFLLPKVNLNGAVCQNGCITNYIANFIVSLQTVLLVLHLQSNQYFDYKVALLLNYMGYIPIKNVYINLNLNTK